MKFCITGGDKRYKYLKHLLELDGFEVAAYCCRFIDSCDESLEKALDGSNVVLGPIPCSRNKRTVALNDCSEIEFKTFFEKLPKGCIFFGGAIPSEMYALAGNIPVYDFFKFEDVAVKNAIPTAEGAIQTAMAESDRTLFGSRILVTGCGRCGKALALTLKGMGANVTVTYRKSPDRAILGCLALNTLPAAELKDKIQKYDFIFNTVPAEIFDKNVLDGVNKAALIIDIAKAPGGVDYPYAAERGIKAIYCPGLPGRVAPFTAAEILKDAILRTVNDVFSDTAKSHF